MTVRERLASRRASETFGFACNALRYVATISFFGDGRLAEIFISNAKAGSDSPTSSQPITTTAPASSPIGLHVRLPTSCPRCGIITAVLTAGSGPHYASQRRIPPCGRGLSSSSWCELEIVQGVWTCLACNSIAPGKITVPSS
jgi:hypothetical protein